jgi:hypothetical protein
MASSFTASTAAPRARAAGGGGRCCLRLCMPARAIAIAPGVTMTSRPRRTATTPARAIATPPGQTTMSRTQVGGPNSACGGWGRASSSLSSYAGEGDSDRPRRDDNVASTLNSYGAGEGGSEPPRTDNGIAYTISGQKGGHPGGVVGVEIKKLPATTEQTILLALMSTSSIPTMKIFPSLEKYPTLCNLKSVGAS